MTMKKTVDEIKTRRLTLRGIDLSDTEYIVRWRSDPDAYRFFKFPHAISEEEHINWYNTRYLQNPDRIDLMCTEDTTGERIGVFGLVFEDGHAEVNYLLSPEARHKGYASEAVSALVRYAAESHRCSYVVAEVHKDNKPSVLLAEHLGFKKDHTDGDFVIYRISAGRQQ